MCFYPPLSKKEVKNLCKQYNEDDFVTKKVQNSTVSIFKLFVLFDEKTQPFNTNFATKERSEANKDIFYNTNFGSALVKTQKELP